MVSNPDDSFALQIQQKIPSIFSLSKQPGNSRKAVVGKIKLNIVEYLKCIKVANPLNALEVDMIAEEIFNSFGYFLTMVDVAAVFNDFILRGETTYNKLEVRDIIKLFDRYDKDKQMAIERYRKKEQEENASNIKRNIPEADVKAMYEKMKAGNTPSAGEIERKEKAKRVVAYAEANKEQSRAFVDDMRAEEIRTKCSLILQKDERERTDNEREYLRRHQQG